MDVKIGMDIDNLFPTKLLAVDDVPDPLRGALKDSISPKERVRLLIYSPVFSTREEFPLEPSAVRPANILLPATLLAVTDSRWLVATEKEDDINIEGSSFADTLFLELTSILLSGQLKIYFAAVGTHYVAMIPFNTVREELYREAIGLILDGIDNKEHTDTDQNGSLLKAWPLKFRLEAARYLPKGQRLITATRWIGVGDGFERALCPDGALLVTERELVSILEQKALPRQHPGDLHEFGGIITYFPLVRLSDFHISHHGRFGMLALLINAAHGSEKLEIVFPSDREKAVLRTMQWTLRK
jgi:hypothetical protein